MKNISIQICNVGPFRNEFIDFDFLGDMFLITGKTGSGKTTIFDCMTYALYGKFPGSRSGIAREMRSKFASPSDKAFVEFTFSIDGKVFRVHRTLPTEKRAAQVSLAHKTSSLLDSWENVAESGTTKINEIIEKQLIHLEMTEFNRIIMLPQGEFASFLKQSTTERSSTLAKLFPVEKYTRIIDKVKEKCEFYKVKLEASENRRLAFGDFKEEAARDKIKMLADSIVSLSEEIKSYDTNRDSILCEIHKVESDISKAKKALELEKKLSELSAKKDEIAQIEESLRKSEEAAPLITYVQTAEKLLQRIEGAKSKCNSYQTALQNAENKIAKLEKKKSDIDEKKAKISGYDVKLSEFEKKKECVIAFKNAKREKEQAETAYNSAVADANTLREERIEAQKEFSSIATKWYLESKDGEENALRFSLSEMLSKEEKGKDSLFTKKAQFEKCTAVEREISELQEVVSKIKSSIEKTQKTHDITLALIEDLEAQKKEAEKGAAAHTLAVLLREGEPCPVCGSLSHPSPARKSDAFTMDDEIEAQKDNLDAINSKLTAQKDKLVKESTRLETKETQLLELLENVATERNALSEELATLSEAIAEKERVISDLASDVEIAQALAESIGSITRKLAAAEAKCTEAKSSLEVKKTLLAEKEAAADGFEDIDEVSSQIADVEAQKAADEKAIGDWTAQYSEAQKEKASMSGSLEAAEKEVEEATREEKNAQNECNAKIEASSFADADEVKAAFIESALSAEKREKIESWKESVSEVKAALAENECEKPLAELEKSLSALQKAEREVCAHKEEAQEAKSEAELEKADEEKKLAEFAQLAIELGKLMKEAEPYQMLLEDISGKGIKDENGKLTKKTSIDTWVLALYFSEILECANPKLEALSAGRYQFKIETDRAIGGGKTGLDFVIEDAYTGQSRLPQTLSGGETFEASISLALALTEVVQSRSGGVKLESLFIDEGFGTLDEEALKKAIDVLHQIQENRVVGVISHVGEMESEIPSKIFVEKEKTGSHILVNGKHLKAQ